MAKKDKAAPAEEPKKSKKAAPAEETKGKKSKPAAEPAKAEKKSKGKKQADDDFAKPSDAKGGEDGWNLTEEAEDRLLLIYPRKKDEIADTYHEGQTKEVIVCDVIVLDEKKPGKSERHDDVWVFGGYLRGALREHIGRAKVVGRLYKDENPPKGKYAWMLEDPSDKDLDVARAYLKSVDPLDGK